MPRRLLPRRPAGCRKRRGILHRAGGRPHFTRGAGHGQTAPECSCPDIPAGLREWSPHGGKVRSAKIFDAPRLTPAERYHPAGCSPVWHGAPPGLFRGLPCTLSHPLGPYPPAPSVGQRRVLDRDRAVRGGYGCVQSDLGRRAVGRAVGAGAKAGDRRRDGVSIFLERNRLCRRLGTAAHPLRAD